jgi:exopolysaccharide transport family protein
MAGALHDQQDVDIDLARLFSSLVANWRRILIVSLGGAAIAFILASLATPLYRAETRILIETRESVFTRPGGAAESDRPILDEEGVVSQVQVITSTDLLKDVARDLDLASQAEFEAALRPSPVTQLLVLLGLRSDPAEVPAEERILETFREKLRVYRVERSRVIVVEFSSEDPELAAAVPNAVAAAYVALQREAKLASNTDATEWLEKEIADLREQVRQAESRVAAFRAESDILIGENNAALATQQLSELSSELSRVRANRAAVEARAEGVRAALERGAALEALPDVMSSPLIQRLRERQVELQAEIADLSATLLDNHPRLRSLRSQLADLDQQIRQEARNILASLETEARTAALRERQLAAEVNRLKAEAARVGEEEVELRALEREAAAQRELLESYLSRYREAASRRERNYVPVDARIFSRAVVPNEPYFPKKVPIAVAAFAASLVIMLLATLLSELFSGRALRPAPQGRVDDIPDIGMPERAGSEDHVEPAHAGQGAGETEAIGIADAADRIISSGIARAVFISPEGDEAAASAVLVAREVADAGLRTLLIDMTLSGAAAEPMLDGMRLPGITNLLAAEAQFADVIHPDRYSECHVIPSGTADPVRAMRAAERLPIILKALETAYDVVVIECGPADGEAIARLLGEDTQLLISVIDPGDEAIRETQKDLKASGHDAALRVSPAGHEPPTAPQPDRHAA